MIASGEVEKLIEILIENENYTEFHNELFLHLANINQVNKNLRQGLIDNSEQLFHLRKLNAALIAIIDKVEK